MQTKAYNIFKVVGDQLRAGDEKRNVKKGKKELLRRRSQTDVDKSDGCKMQ